MTIKFIFAWYDLWIGMYWSEYKRTLYILPLPMFGIALSFPRIHEEIDLPSSHLGEPFYGDN